MKMNIFLKKCLTVGIIILFIGITVAPNINQSIVKASTDDDLVEVTTQACGIQGYGDTTVKLTKEQYNDLEQYLVEFGAQLNQTTTREETVPIFKEAVVELNTYGLLPKEMSIEKAQRLVTGWNQFSTDRVLNNRQQKMDNLKENILCLLYLSGTKNQSHYPEIFYQVVGPLYLSTYLVFRIFCPSQYSFFYEHFPKLCDFVFGTLFSLNDEIPFRFLATVMLIGDADCSSLGLKGIVRSSNHDYFIQGFTGLTLRPSDDKVYVIGFARKITSV